MYGTLGGPEFSCRLMMHGLIEIWLNHGRRLGSATGLV